MRVRNALIRLAGHNPQILDEDSQGDNQSIVHLGWVVLIGAAVAGLNWAVGGYVFAGGAGSAAAIGATVIAGVIGVCLVVIIDRSALYSMDTYSGRRLALWPMVVF